MMFHQIVLMAVHGIPVPVILSHQPGGLLGAEPAHIEEDASTVHPELLDLLFEDELPLYLDHIDDHRAYSSRLQVRY